MWMSVLSVLWTTCGDVDMNSGISTALQSDNNLHYESSHLAVIPPVVSGSAA